MYRFRHALIRETLYGELTPQARAEAHQKIAEVLDNSPGRSHAELAYHFLRAAPASAQAAARAVHHCRRAGQEALDALAYEEAAGHFRRALHVQGRAALATTASRAGLLLSLAEALTKTGPDPDAARAIDEAARLARHADEPRLLAAAALLNAQHLDFNAPATTSPRCSGRPPRRWIPPITRCGPARWPGWRSRSSPIPTPPGPPPGRPCRRHGRRSPATLTPARPPRPWRPRGRPAARPVGYPGPRRCARRGRRDPHRGPAGRRTRDRTRRPHPAPDPPARTRRWARRAAGPA